ncbi:MAG: SMP-30/gluconolactonase/LRE family protein [Planctomycetaceae bacterium]|nr:SMP-30/gluconolactonase/LRE family protein [Planctomycetaceae bacterium]
MATEQDPPCIELTPPTTAASAAFLEGPACTADGTLYCSDIINNRILRLQSGAMRFETFRQPSGRANGLLIDPHGRLLICEGNEFGPDDGNRRVTRLDLGTGAMEVLCDQWRGKRLNSPNDVACTSDGHVFFTDPCYGDRSTMELDHDSVYHVDPDGQIGIAVSQPDIQRPNGVHLSPDERTLYLVDSCPVIGGNRKIWAFDLDERRRLSGQRTVYDFAPGRGGDGMTVDSEGMLYIAAGIRSPRGPHETTDVAPGIYLVTPQGQLRRRIPIAEDVLTNITFGGDDLRTLYITAGKSLLTTRTLVRGWAVHRQAGAPTS